MRFYLAYSGTYQIYYTLCNKFKIKTKKENVPRIQSGLFPIQVRFLTETYTKELVSVRWCVDEVRSPRVPKKTARLEPQYCITDYEHKERAYPCQKQEIGPAQISL